MQLKSKRRHRHSQIKVNVSVVGRFHLFDLARQLEQRGLLNRLVTTYPSYFGARFRIPTRKIIGLPILEILLRVRHRISWLIAPVKVANFVNELLDYVNSRVTASANVLIAASGSALKTFSDPKNRSKVKILERGSTHYSYQMRILSQEYDDLGLKFQPNHLAWKRELLEYEWSDFISVPSDFVRDTFIEHGIAKEKLFVNPYGVDLRDFKRVERGDEVFRVICAGGATIRKGFHYLLEAMMMLEHLEIELWHLGIVSEEMRPFVSEFGARNVTFKGHVSQNALYRYYSQGNVFALPSLEEGLAMVQLQAMACELPLIVTENAGIGSLLKEGDNGYIVPARSASHIAEKLEFLYHNRDLARRMGKNAADSVRLQGYTWDDYGARYEAFLKVVSST